jgi:hypothetical protein
MQVTTLIDLSYAQEPVSLEQAAAWCKVAVPVTDAEGNFTPEGDLLKSLLVTSRQWCEHYTGLSFGPKTLQVELTYSDYLNRGELPYGPNVVITKVTDSEGVDVTTDLFSSTSYYAEWLKGASVSRDVDYGFEQPFLSTYYTVEYTAGYEVGKLPSMAQTAILKTCLELYNNRENSVIGTIVADLPMDAKSLLNLIRPKVLFV